MEIEIKAKCYTSDSFDKANDFIFELKNSRKKLSKLFVDYLKTVGLNNVKIDLFFDISRGHTAWDELTRKK